MGVVSNLGRCLGEGGLCHTDYAPKRIDQLWLGLRLASGTVAGTSILTTAAGDPCAAGVLLSPLRVPPT